MKRVIISVIAVIIVLVVAFAVNYSLNENSKEQRPFYVGVTYGGDNSDDAKILIDRVKEYTNLFVVASGSLQNNITELENTCDYAVKSGLDIIVYFGSYETQSPTTAPFIKTAQERWGSHFLGVYYGDEPGGKMLDGDRDSPIDLGEVPNVGHVIKYSDRILIGQANDSVIKEYTFSGMITLGYGDLEVCYSPDGTIRTANFTDPQNIETLIYLPNGTVTLQIGSNQPVIVSDRGDISQFEPYQELWNSRPLQTANDSEAVSTAYINAKQVAASLIRNQSDLNLFTSDYALYWWDYQGGYDTVFAHLGWNNSVSQEIGLVRGAANLQGKSWGTIIAWKYTQAPYLTDGDEMFDQMKASYEAGAEYMVIFNYAEDMEGPYGTLKIEHFDALKRFWNDVVQNSAVVHGGIRAEAAFVFPKNYGWGLRRQDDSVWGLWEPTMEARQAWQRLQDALAKHGLRLDIVYDDAAYPFAGKYRQVYYWNQTASGQN